MKKKQGMMKAPMFDTVLNSGHELSTRSVSVTFAAVDRAKYELDFSAKCVPMAIMALTLELGRLAAKLPEESTTEVQGVRIVGSELAMQDDGTVALVLTLAGGGELLLEIERDDLVKLREQIDEAADMVDPQTR